MAEQFGRYRLDQLIGDGGMGEVWQAFDTVNRRPVALKRLRTELATDRDFTERFRRESELAARLNEPHIIPIHGYGEIDGRLYIDMRLVNGDDLSTVLKNRGPLPPARAVGIVSQIAEALDAAHGAGLVHRDVTPKNILIVGEAGSEFAYLIDFGISREMNRPKGRRSLPPVSRSERPNTSPPSGSTVSATTAALTSTPWRASCSKPSPTRRRSPAETATSRRLARQWCGPMYRRLSTGWSVGGSPRNPNAGTTRPVNWLLLPTRR